MRPRLFLAGAGGAIGTRLAPLLLDAGYDVYGSTRSTEKATALAAAGVKPLVVDVFDLSALMRVMAAAQPEIVIHQLTDLPRGLDPGRLADAIARNARIRNEGTRNLVAAAIAAGARRLIAQSIAWAYAPGPQPHSEDDPLDAGADGTRAVTVGGVEALERLTLHSPPLTGIVLRYGQLYGPGTGKDGPADSAAPLHVDAAASAALLATRYPVSAIFNIAEANAYVSTTKACQELGWAPDFRLRSGTSSLRPPGSSASPPG